jgi:membrane complex biogenesis BtpA family protein
MPITALLPSLIGVIHLRPLPGSPRFDGHLQAIIDGAISDALILAEAGFEGVIIENFGDAPFLPGSVSPVTTAVMTSCALSVRTAAPNISLGINVLRNDAEAALAVAIGAGADFIRINVHTGARLTDQGIIEGVAHRTLRLRRELGAERLRLLCDVSVKHSAPVAERPLGEEAEELATRGLADAILVTGTGTGKGVAPRDLEEVLTSVRIPVFVASGVKAETLPEVRLAHGVIVGSNLRRTGRAGDPIDRDLAMYFADAFRAAWLPSP